MIEWLWILIFGSFVTLTDEPVDLAVGVNQIPLRKPISAINSGATVYVDVTSLVPAEAMANVFLARQWVEENVPMRCQSAVLAGDRLERVKLEFNGYSSYNKQSLWLSLDASNGIPLRQDFSELTLSSCMALPGVLIYWKNHGK
jgi:hypothetical protein